MFFLLGVVADQLSGDDDQLSGGEHGLRCLWIPSTSCAWTLVACHELRT